MGVYFYFEYELLKRLGGKSRKKGKGGQRRGKGKKRNFFLSAGFNSHRKLSKTFLENKYDLVIDLFRTTLHCLKSKNVLG